MTRVPTPQERFPTLSGIGKVTTPFGAQTQQEGFHPGVDVANANGTPLPSTTPGVVTAVDYGHQQGENNFGNSVVVTDPEGNRHRYSHLKRGYVAVGQKVGPGQPIAEMGNSGAAYSASGHGDGTNLDYRIVDAYGRFLDPTPYIKRYL